MKPIGDALRASGASPTEIAHITDFPGGLPALWESCADPVLMMRIAAVFGADPKASVAIAVQAAESVLPYIGQGEPRPRRAIEGAKAWLRGNGSAKACEQAGQQAEAVGASYRGATSKSKVERRAYRAAAHAAFAAAKAALVARDAAVTTELDYDTEYTFEDAWDGARVSCAIGAAQALIDAVEAAVAAVSANVTIETNTPLAGTAAADETRPLAMAWAASIVRSHLSADVLQFSSAA